MKIIPKISLMLFALIFLPTTASAGIFQSSEQLTINELVTDDLYASGAMITISSPVNGDVFVGGATINITGPVSEDLFAGGSSIIISGAVGDDVRVAGSSVVISGDIGDDLFAVGSLIQITSNVKGNAHFAGAAVMIDGDIDGDVLVTGGSLIINGQVNGNVMSYAKEIILGDGAQIDGVLTYQAENEMDFGNAKIGGIIYQESSNVSAVNNFDKDLSVFLKTLYSVGLIIKLIGLLIAGLIIGLAFPKTGVIITERTTNKFAISLFTGLIAIVATPIIAVTLLMTAIGWPFAFALILVAMLLTIISAVYLGIVAGSLIIKLVKKEKSYEVTWYSIVIGVLVGAVITFIPFIGWLAIWLLFMTVLGAILGLLYELSKKLK